MENWQKSYDRMLAAGPPETPTADLTVDFTVWVSKEGDLADVTEAVGGHAYYSTTAADGQWREVTGHSVVEEVESAEEAEEIITDELLELGAMIDADNLSVTAQIPDDERDPDEEKDW